MNTLYGLGRRCLMHPRLAFGLALLAVLLCTPSLKIGWILDDDFHRAALTAPEELPELKRSPAELFAFVGERWQWRADTLPWWASPELSIAFFRPLSGFSHWLDYQLWPEEPMWMHLHSLFWLGLVVVAATLLYRRLAPPDGMLTAGLAALFFAVDDVHGIPAVWIANRNILLGMVFGLLTLIAYHRWRRDGWRIGAFVAPVLLLLAVLSAEASVACGAYLLSYALFLDRGSLQQRLVALLPCAAVGVGWALAYRAAGFGVGGADTYLDPVARPLRFLSAVAERGPIQLWGQLSFPPSDVYNFLSISLAGQVWLAVVVLLTLFGLLLLPILRREPLARFWAFGMLLAVIPSCATFPTVRQLFYTSLGSAGLMAILVVHAWRRSEGHPTWWRRTARLTTIPLLFIHLVQAPLGLATAAVNMSGGGGLFMKAAASLPSDATISTQQAVIVNAPTFFAAGIAPVHQAMRGRAIPTEVLTLATGLYPIEVHRPAARTLVVRPQGGFAAPAGSAPPGQEPAPFNFFYIFQLIDAVYRAPEPYQIGQRIEQRRVSIEIIAVTDDARPAEIRVDFDADLEDASWRWLQWQDGGFVAWHPPAVGATVTLPALTW